LFRDCAKVVWPINSKNLTEDRETAFWQLGNILADRNGQDFDVARQIFPDDSAIFFPAQLQSPVVAITVGVCPIKRHRVTRNLNVLNRKSLGKGRIGYQVDCARGFSIHAVAAHLYATDKFTLLGA